MSDQSPPQFLHNELLAGESIVWWGQPTLKASVLQDVLKIAIGALGLLAYCGAHPTHFPAQFSWHDPLNTFFSLLDAAPFLGVLWLIAMPIQSVVRSKKTFYLMTNKRALIVVRGAYVQATPLFLLTDLRVNHAAGFATFEWMLPSNWIDEDNSVRTKRFVFYGIAPPEEKLLELRLTDSSA